MEIIPRKDGLSRTLRVGNRTVSFDLNGFHNVVPIDRTTLPRTAKEFIPATEVKLHDDIPYKAAITRDE